MKDLCGGVGGVEVLEGKLKSGPKKIVETFVGSRIIQIDTLDDLVIDENIIYSFETKDFYLNFANEKSKFFNLIIKLKLNFNDSIKDLIFPEKLKKLIFGENFNNLIGDDYAPYNDNYQPSGLFNPQSYLPLNINTLIFGRHFNQPLCNTNYSPNLKTFLPTSLTTLIFGDDFNQFLNKMKNMKLINILYYQKNMLLLMYCRNL